MNTRFAVAVHILTYLKVSGDKAISSEVLAASVSTNPSLIRRLLSQLGKAGLTTSLMGTGGGAMLARPAEKITLLDVYEAVDEDGEVFAVHQEPNPDCPVGRNIHTVLNVRIQAAEHALKVELGQTTVGDLAADMLRRIRRQKSS